MKGFDNMIAKDKSYKYEYYMQLPEGSRTELIGGQIYDMAAAPNTIHQEIIGDLFNVLKNFLKGKSCKVFAAPFDVFLIRENKNLTDCKNIVQPDISIICDRNKITRQGCVGAPDFIAEVVSPSTRAHDYVKKLNLYNKFGIKEYWIVNPTNKTVMVYANNGGGFAEPQFFTFNDKIKVNIFDNLTIDFNEFDLDFIFEDL